MKFRDKDFVRFIRNGNTKQSHQKNGCQAYFNTPCDPRVPNPRKLISRNYDMARSSEASNLFPRENLVTSFRRHKNLSEILSPTIQGTRAGMGGGDGPAPARDGRPTCAKREREGTREGRTRKKEEGEEVEIKEVIFHPPGRMRLNYQATAAAAQEQHPKSLTVPTITIDSQANIMFVSTWRREKCPVITL